MNKQKLSVIFLIIMGIGLIGAFAHGYFIAQPDIEANGVWVIATPYGTEGGGKGGSPYIKFKYSFENKEYKSKENGFQGKYRKILANRYLIRVSSKTPTLCYFTDDYLVPDSIKSSPLNGWKELPNWAKKK